MLKEFHIVSRIPKIKPTPVYVKKKNKLKKNGSLITEYKWHDKNDKIL